jgi:hypothetical protein
MWEGVKVKFSEKLSPCALGDCVGCAEGAKKYKNEAAEHGFEKTTTFALINNLW